VDLQALHRKALRKPVQEPQRPDNARGACQEAGCAAAMAMMLAFFGVLLMTIGGLIALAAMALYIGLLAGDSEDDWK